jgi:hypothetical protein
MQSGVFHMAALILLISISHFYPLDSMFKILLSIYVSFLALTCAGQSSPTEDKSNQPAYEDSNKIVTDFTSRIADNSKVVLSWGANGTLPAFFAIERGDNGKNFEIVSVLSNLGKQSVFQWTDDSPIRGKSYYRIRYAYKQGDSLYSKTLPISIAGYVSFKFYPNPVDQILIVRSDAPLDVTITDANGRLRISQARVQGISPINVSSLEKGVYLIRFINRLTNVMTQEKLMKN